MQQLRNLTTVQRLAILVAMLSFTAGASAQIVPLVGEQAALLITSACAFLAGLVSVPLTLLTSQGQQVKAVQEMRGVQQILVNAQANPTLASIAVDPAQPKVMPAAEDAAAVVQIARSGAS